MSPLATGTFRQIPPLLVYAFGLGLSNELLSLLLDLVDKSLIVRSSDRVVLLGPSSTAPLVVQGALAPELAEVPGCSRNAEHSFRTP